MALDLLRENCSVSMPNTGKPDCVNAVGVLKGVIFCQTLKSYPSDTTLATLIASLKADVLATNPKDRLYPLFDFLELTADNTQERAKIQKGLGGVSFGEAKSRDFRYELANMGAKYFAKISQLSDAGKLYFFGIDAQDNLVCAKNAADELIPIRLQAQCIQEPKFNTDTTVNFYLDLITSDPYALGRNVVLVDCSSAPLENELSGLYDVTLAAEGGSLKIDVSGIIDVNGTDFFDLYQTEAAVAGAFKVVNGSGAVVTPSAVVAVAGEPVLIRLTVPAGAGYSVSLVDPTALSVLNIGSAAEGGYESNTVTGITVTA